MSCDADTPGRVAPLRVDCGSYGCAFSTRRGLLGWAGDLTDGLVWPILTTAFSLLPGRLGRLIRTEDNPNTEDDVVG